MNDLNERLVEHEHKPLGLSVNLCEFNLRPEFVERIKAVVTQYDFPPSLLELEILEGVTLENEAPAAFLKKCSDWQTSQDDFGVKRASMERLLLLDFNTIKIDQRFVNEIKKGSLEARLLRQMIEMIKRLRKIDVARAVFPK